MAQAGGIVGPRWLAYLLGVIGVVTLIIALVHTPFGEWSANARFLAAVLLVVTLLYFFIGVRGNVNLVGKWSPRTSMIFSGIATLAAGFILGATIFSDEWTVTNIITTGLWSAIGLLFLTTFVMASRQMKLQQ